MKPKRRPLLDGAVLIGMMGACLAVGGLGAVATADSVNTWYLEIQKPPWTPPSAVFGPVWTVLYLMMGVSAWRVWRSPLRKRERVVALEVFTLQLALNALWSHLFFGLQNPGLALVEIVLLWLSILATLVLFHRIEAVAGWLLAPYLAWVTFATALNASIWVLNRG